MEKILIAGLGNPGEQYKLTRHNAGFIMLDEFVKSKGLSPFQKMHGGEGIRTSYTRTSGDEIKIVLIKPLSFMNLSGGAVAKTLHSENISIDHLLVLHDEIELAFMDIRLKNGGGHKGHNGLRDIIAQTKSADFSRLRIGVGRPIHPTLSVSDYVLAKFHSQEIQNFHEMFTKGFTLIEEWMEKITKKS